MFRNRADTSERTAIKMRLVAIPPIVFSGIALIITLLCVFAGDKTTFLEQDYIVNVNTSRVAFTFLNSTISGTKTSTGLGSLWSDLPLASEIENVTTAVTHRLEDAAHDGVDDWAAALGLHDFYSLHAMGYCDGYYSGNGTGTRRNVTYCSTPAAFNHLNLSAVLMAELNATGSGLSLGDLLWPHEIDNAVAGLESAVNAVFVCYCIALIFIGLSFFGAIGGLFLHGSLSAKLNVLATKLAFFFLLIASAALTAGMISAVNTINEFGAGIDVTATRGETILGMTWTATLLMFSSGIAWVVEIVVARRKRALASKMDE